MNDVAEAKFCAKTTKVLNASTPRETIKVVCQKAPICEAIYIPETNEVVVLTTSEYVQLADSAELYDKYIKKVVAANKGTDAGAIVDAREELAEFIKKQTDNEKDPTTEKTPAEKTPASSLTIDNKHIFIEVIELSSKKSSYVPRVMVNGFRTPNKSYALKPITSDPIGIIESTASNPLRTANGQLDQASLKKRFAGIKAEIGHKWELNDHNPPLSGQLSSKYLARLLGAPAGIAAATPDRFNQWLDTFDSWIAELNKNLNWVKNDRTSRKKKLLTLIDPGATAAEHQSPLLNDQSILVNMQQQVNEIWSKSPTEKLNVKWVNNLKWEEFADSLLDLENNCLVWANTLCQWPTLMQFKKDQAFYSKNTRYPDDKDYPKREKLVSGLRAKAKEVKTENTKIAEANSQRGEDTAVFDEESLGHVKNEVDYIWGQSDKSEDKNLVRELKSKKWSSFAKNDQTLLKNRQRYTQKITDQGLPEYMFDASAQAQFMRYAYGATGSAAFNFDPSNGNVGFSGKAEAKADFALAEGKVNAQWLLPDSKGAYLTLPSLSRTDTLEWTSIDAGIPSADTFEFDKTFLLPDIITTLGIITKRWKIYKSIYTGNKIQVIGHTDASGSETYNDALSQQRAKVAYELLTYNYSAWFKRFENREWAEREIKIMFKYILGQGVELDGRGQGGLEDTYWKKMVYRFQRTAEGYYVKTPSFPDVKKDCDVSNLTSVPDINRDKKGGKFHLTNGNGSIGFTTPRERDTLKKLIQAYMQKGTGNRFLLDSSFRTPAFAGKGESDLVVKTTTSQREAKNRRVEIHLVESRISGTEMKASDIPLGYLRLQIEAYLTGYAGANAMISAEAGFSSTGGLLQALGLREGDAATIGVEKEPEANYQSQQSSTATTHTLQNGKYAKYTVDAGVSTKAGAFLGAQATAGMKALLEWQCPKPEPEFVQPNVLVMPTQTCKADIKQAPKVIKLAGFKDGFAELGSAGYAITGSAGVGLEGEIQIGFDTESGKFIVKCKAKAVLGLGAGGAFEFAINANNVYWFIRFVHAQLNDHDFNFIQFMEPDAFEIFSAWTWELLKKGHLFSGVAAGVAGVAIVGMIGINELTGWDKLRVAWLKGIEQGDTAERLALQVNSENFLFSYMSPEVKGRLLYTLSYESFFSTNEEREQAIIKALSTVASKNEYKEILEHMGPPLDEETPQEKEDFINKGIMSKRQTEKLKRVGNIESTLANEVGSSEKRLLSILDDAWFFGGKELTEFKEWKKKLPEVAPKMIET